MNPDLIAPGTSPTRRLTPIDPRLILPFAAVGLTLSWILWACHAQGPWNLIVLISALAAHAAMLLTSRSDTPFSMRAALVIVGVALALAALAPLHHSRDLYLYDMYGRTLATHHLNPFLHTPSSVAHDPVLGFVSEQWHGQQSIYGPAFVGLSAVVATVAGTSELLIRLAWQSLMAGAAFVAVVLVGRRTRRPAAVLALGCSPVLLATVNDAHNDVLIGLALLGAVLLLEQRRYRLAGIVAALAIATKLPVALPVLAIAFWVMRRRGLRPSWQFLAPIVGIVTAAYLLVGGKAALVPLRANAGDDSRFAIWQTLRNRDFEQLISQGVSRHVVLETVRDQMSMYALGLLVVCVAVALWRYRRAARPGEAAALVGVVVLITSTYVMPWYPAMLLPVAALAWRSRANVLVQVQGAFLLVAYANGAGVDPTTGFGQLLEQRAVWINLVLLAAALCWARPSERWSPSHAEVTSRTLLTR